MWASSGIQHKRTPMNIPDKDSLAAYFMKRYIPYTTLFKNERPALKAENAINA
jgi:hypothetical protein